MASMSISMPFGFAAASPASIKPKVGTVCFGVAASQGALLLAGGEKGMRYAMPNACIVIHQPQSGCGGHVEDVRRQVKEAVQFEVLPLFHSWRSVLSGNVLGPVLSQEPFVPVVKLVMVPGERAIKSFLGLEGNSNFKMH
ncbi:hypothetical protein COCNU_13G005240 [Cocos nucifera]|uniref:ATP-dependent Clp protease proteolytic subunit n=1 Tax=Cocos nucifera TaxID=13894 RepID=A0A8K0NB98_COCNU|nr:hypothetical protein COCNU_13G005240 [Cocos nucifera]